jgi:FkbM family methyltransferase
LVKHTGLHRLRRVAGLIRDTARRFDADARALGKFSAASLLAENWGRSANSKPLRVASIDGLQHPIYYRDGTSDADVVQQIFRKQEYACVASESGVRTILDCGANIGCSAVYLLNRYPQARLVAVEPDRGNFEILRRNLKPYRGRALAVNAGVWSQSVPLKVQRGDYRDGREWSFRVRPCAAGEVADFQALTVGDLMKAGGFNDLDLLKIDVERSELELFNDAELYQPWLRKTRTIAVELHDEECEAVFHNAVASSDWEVTQSGELTIGRRREAPVASEDASVL